MLLNHRTRIADHAARRRLPTVSGQIDYAQAGGLLNYGPSVSDGLRRAATYVDISKHVGRVNDESILVDEIAA